MDNKQKEIINKLVYTFAQKANINNQEEISNTINKLYSMNIDDSIDTILVSLNDMLSQKKLSMNDILENSSLLLQLNPNKYKSIDDLIHRLKWIKSMNLEHPSIPLTENHQLVLDTFDKFNNLIQNKFDCYYTGGIMGYLATNHELERYHGDLDLFINEQQLLMLKNLIDSSVDFTFVSNMNHKEVNGHEYKIIYKNTSMSIGLFLFERQPDDSLITKEYYYDKNSPGQLFVDEHHFSKDYSSMSFPNITRYHNNIPYKMMSLESIYNSKKNSRLKDQYDANIIKKDVDMMIDYKLDVEKKHNFDVIHKPVSQSIIHITEKIIKEEKEQNSEMSNTNFRI